MADLNLQCTLCSSRAFIRVGTFDLRGGVDNAGVLNPTDAKRGIDWIRCLHCGESYAADRFVQIGLD